MTDRLHRLIVVLDRAASLLELELAPRVESFSWRVRSWAGRLERWTESRNA